MRFAKNAAKGVSRRWNHLTRYLRRCALYLRHPQYRLLRREASRLYRIWSQNTDEVSNDLVHPLWLHVQPVFAQMVSDGVPIDFLQVPVVKRMFYRMGFGQPQQYELNYLRDAGEDIWNLVKQYRESSVGGPVMDCPELNISANTLGMFYYFARVLGQREVSRLHTVVEFGGGYGSLCRVFSELLPDPPTYVIIDLPEMLALQYTYLNSSSQQQIVAHTSQPVTIQRGSINLVPVAWAADLAMTCDLFISTFALSESSVVAQDMIIRNKFLGADTIYLVGQHTDVELWRGLALESMEPVQRAARDLYANVQLQPFHFADSWELIARGQKFNPSPAAGHSLVAGNAQSAGARGQGI